MAKWLWTLPKKSGSRSRRRSRHAWRVPVPWTPKPTNCISKGDTIEKNRTYALAYAALAESYVMLSTGFDILPGKDTLPKAREAALKALEFDPTLADAHVSLGLVAACYDWDRQAANKHFKKAL